MVWSLLSACMYNYTLYTHIYVWPVETGALQCLLRKDRLLQGKKRSCHGKTLRDVLPLHGSGNSLYALSLAIRPKLSSIVSCTPAKKNPMQGVHSLCGCIAMETGTKPHSHIMPGYGRIEVVRWHLPCAALGSFASSPKREVVRRGMVAFRRREEETSHGQQKWPIKCEKSTILPRSQILLFCCSLIILLFLISE